MSDPAAIKKEILRLTREYSRQVHASFRPAADPDRQPWQPGTTIPYAGRVFTEDEVEAADDAAPPLTTTTFGDGGIDDLD